MKKCPFCAEEIQDEAVVCRFCGKDLIKPAEPIKQEPTQAPEVPVSIKSKSTNKAFFVVISIFVVLIALVGWYYYYGPCGKQLMSKATSQLDVQISKWSDSEKVANSTGRIALSGPIANLQSNYQATSDISVPECLYTATRFSSRYVR